MNTKEVISVDYVKTITPIINGDEVLNAFTGEVFVVDEKEALNGMEAGLNTYFVVSFAPRTNTGKQPVGDDVVIDIETFTDVAVFCDWASKKPWKPNHEAMAAKCKAEQAGDLKGPPQSMIFSSEYYQSGQEVVNTDLHTHIVDLKYHDIDKDGKMTPVLKPEDFGAIPDDKPKIGSQCKVTFKPGVISHVGELKYLSAAYIIMFTDGWEQHFHAASWELSQVETKTDEEKLRGAIIKDIRSGGWNDLEYLCDRLLASDKYFIKLN